MFRPDSAFKAKFLSAGVSARQLAVYRNLKKDPIFESFCHLVDLINLDLAPAESLIDAYFDLAHRLLDLSVPQDFLGDAWQFHLISLLIRDENPFSRRCEREEWARLSPALKKAAASDLLNLQNLAGLEARSVRHMVQSKLADTAGWVAELPSFEDWPGWDKAGTNKGPTDPAAEQGVWTSFMDGRPWAEKLPELAEHYHRNGTGIFSVYRAFRWKKSDRNGSLEGIAHPDPISFDSLFGYRSQRKTIIDNTEKFVRSLPANNILLYGERGTGKSSTVKALLPMFGARGLRLVEAARQDLGDFPRIIEILAERSQKFIIFVDDLSFEENDAQYTHLKAVLEGGLAAAPANILVYATSNRRHLVRERFTDRDEITRQDEVRVKDTLQEKLSLADRFGITVTFTTPVQAEYLTIVEGLVKKDGLEIPREELHRLALQWELSYNGRSGRTARQFVNWLAGEKRKGF